MTYLGRTEKKVRRKVIRTVCYKDRRFLLRGGIYASASELLRERNARLFFLQDYGRRVGEGGPLGVEGAFARSHSPISA